MRFGYDKERAEAAVSEIRTWPGIFHVRIWLNEGELSVGDDLMYVLVGGDIRPHVIAALEALVAKLKEECVTEEEINCP
jgi:molybdopterin synthase catalytic subunit